MSDQDERFSITVRAVPSTRKKPQIHIKQQKTRFICRGCTTKSVYYLPYCLCCGGKMDEYPQRPSFLQIEEVPRRQREPLQNFLMVLSPQIPERNLRKILKQEQLLVATDLMLRENIVLSTLLAGISVETRLVEGVAPAGADRVMLPAGHYTYPDRLNASLLIRIREIAPLSGDLVRVQFGPLLHFALLLLDKLSTSRPIRDMYLDENLAQLAGLIGDVVSHATTLFAGGSKLEKLGECGVAAHLAPHREGDGPIVIKRRSLRAGQANPQYGSELAMFVQELQALADLLENVYSRLLLRIAGQDSGKFPPLMSVPVHSKTYGVLHRLHAEFEILDNTLKEIMDLVP